MNEKLANAKNRVKNFVNNDTNIVATKSVARIVAKRTVSGVVVTLAHQNVTTYTKAQKAGLYIGAYLIGSMVADAAAAHVSNEIDDIVKAVKELVNDEEETESAETESIATESTDQ